MLGGPPGQAFPMMGQLPRFAAPQIAAPQIAAAQVATPQAGRAPMSPMPFTPAAAAGPPASHAWQQQPARSMPAAPPRMATPPAPNQGASPSVNAALALDQSPRPKIRMQGPETFAAPLNPHAGFQTLVMPTPEALGIAAATAVPPIPTADVDWNEIRGRLRQLGAVGFHLDQLAGGNWRATLLVPDGASTPPRRVEAVAASEAGAVAAVFDQAGSR